ncbi:MAG: hypothetical protein MMC33_009101 [Icmadophila ericetorum]|nr:hypothetical protein [Icmadophila ericetorum]
MEAQRLAQHSVQNHAPIAMESGRPRNVGDEDTMFETQGATFCYVAFPKIAQTGVNGSTIEVDSLVLSDPTETSFHLTQTSVVYNGGAYHPLLDAFNVSLNLAGSTTPYAYITIPSLVAAAQATTNIDQEVQIANLEAFTEYNIAVVTSETININLNGSTWLHEEKFPATKVNYDKTVTMKGLNNLSGFNLTSFQILTEPEADGTNMIGTVYIPNPSVMTISMGNVTFNNFVAGTFVGTSSLENLVLKPGNNNLSMKSAVNQTLIIGLVTTTYTDGIVPIDVVGNSSVYNGVHLTYFEQALAANTQHIKLNVLSALGGGI